MPYKFSPSSLALLKECPHCFWLQFNKGIKRPDGAFPSLPSGMDRVLKKHFDSFRDREMLPPELNELKGYKLFEDAELLEEWRNNRKGIQWEDEEGNILKGAVDNIHLKGDKLVVLDYKTRGYPLKEDTADHYQDQLDIYNFLLRKNGFATENYAYLLFYIPNKVNAKGDVIFDAELVKRTINVDNASYIFNKALKTLSGNAPNPNTNCGFCQWKQH